ncbi:hypothetical protein FRC17_002971, partial [Serendipita sp. 399]
LSRESANGGLTFGDFFTNDIFRNIVVSLLATLGLYIFASLLFFEPWHMITSFVQYLLMAPSYIAVLNVYAFANVHDVSWGTKGDNKVATDLGTVSTAGKNKGEVEVAVPTDQKDINAAFEDAMHLLGTKAEKAPATRDASTKQEDYYRNFRTNVLLTWTLTNGLLGAVVVSTAAKADDKGSQNAVKGYMGFVLFSVAILACFVIKQFRALFKKDKSPGSAIPASTSTPTAPTSLPGLTGAAAITGAAQIGAVVALPQASISNQVVQNITTTTPDATPSTTPSNQEPPPRQTRGSQTDDWLGRAALFLNLTKAAAEGAGLTPLKGACEGVVTLLEAVQAVKTNQSAWGELIRSIQAHLSAFQKQLDQLGIGDILEDVEPALSHPVNEYHDLLLKLLADIFAESQIKDEDIEANKLTLKVLARRIGVTKLESEAINDYRSRLTMAQSGIVQQLLLYVASSVHDSKDGSILNELRVGELKHSPRPRECQKETRKSILASCKDWSMDANTPNILWIKGHPGTGKSTIASSLVGELGIKRKRLGSSFFFQRQNAKATTNALWRTVAYDLARHPAIRKDLVVKMKKEEIELGTPNIDVLFGQLIHDSLMKISNMPIEQSPIVVVDALDECGGLDGPRSADRQNLLRTLNSWSKLPSNFKLIVTSREEKDIVALFSQFSQNKLQTIELLAGERTEDQSTRDIEAFLRMGFKDIAKGYESLPADWPGSTTIESLAVKAGGLFIWASTVIKFVSTGEAEEQLNEALKGKGTGDMNALYEQVLRTSFPAPTEQVLRNLRSIVGTIIVAKEPLRRSVMARLLSITEPQVEHICNGMQSVMEDQGGLRFYHQSFIDFLLDDRPEASKFAVAIRESHNTLASRCLWIMKEELRFNICNIESSYTFNTDIPDLDARIKCRILPHLLYASRFWTSHLEGSPYSGQMLDDIRYFLTEQFLYWLEVISLHHLLSDAGGILALLVNWLKEHEQENLVAIAVDMRRFIVHFNDPISQSVPHIYLSALPFAPRESHVAKLYSPRFSQTLVVDKGGYSTWSPLLNTLTGHTDQVCSVAFSRNGRRIVSSSYDRTVRIWDAETGQQLGASLEGHEDKVSSVAFSPDGRRIVSSSYDKTVRIWDVETGQQLGASLEGHEYATVRIWDVETGQQLGASLEGHEYAVTSVAFSPDGQRIVSSSYDRTVRIWDVETSQQLGTSLEGHEDRVSSVAFSPDGRRIVSGSYDRTVQIWDAETGQQLGASLKGHEYPVTSVAFSSDGQRIVSGSFDKTVRIWDAETGQQLGASLKGHKYSVSSVAFSSDGRRIVSSSYDMTVRIWDVETGQQLGASLEGHEDGVSSVAFSPDGRRIVSGPYDKTVRIWDAETGQQLGAPLEGHEYPVGSVAFSSDGRRIVSGSIDETARIWDAETGQQLGASLKGHKYSVSCVAFSSDGRRIVSGSTDRTVRIWNAETGQQLGASLEGHEDKVTSVALSPDPREAGSGSPTSVRYI